MSRVVVAESFEDIAKQVLSLLEGLLEAEPHAWDVAPAKGNPNYVKYDGRGVRVEIRLIQDGAVNVVLSYHERDAPAGYSVNIAHPASDPLLDFVNDFRQKQQGHRTVKALEDGRGLVDALGTVLNHPGAI